MKDVQSLAKLESAAAQECAHTTLSEGLFAAAYGGQSAMGRSFFSASATAASIESFRTRAYALNGAVLSATGIDDHESFVKAVEEGFSESHVGTGAGAAPSPVFLGGETRIHAPAGYTHLTLGFECAAGNSALDNVVKACIDLSVDGVSGFAKDGLVGVYGGAAPSDATGALDAMCAAITAAPTPEIIQRAKAIAKAEAVFKLDGGSQSLADSMASSIVESGSFSAAGVAAAYDSITVDGVQGAFSAMAKSNPAMSVVGDLSSTPYQGSIAAKFG